MAILSASIKINDVSFVVSVDTEKSLAPVSKEGEAEIQAWLNDVAAAVQTNCTFVPYGGAVAMAVRGVSYIPFRSKGKATAA